MSSPGRRRRRTACSSSARSSPRSFRKRRSSTPPGRAIRSGWCGCSRCWTSSISTRCAGPACARAAGWKDSHASIAKSSRTCAASAPKIRVGTLAIPLDTIELVDVGGAAFDAHKQEVASVEQERYGAAVQYPPDVLRAGRRPLLQFQLETLEATAGNPGAIGLAARDRVSGRFVGYVLGSALENHDEE